VLGMEVERHTYLVPEREKCEIKCEIMPTAFMWCILYPSSYILSYNSSSIQ